MRLNQQQNQKKLHCIMSMEIMQLYSTLTDDKKEKVTRLIATLLDQQSNDQQSSDLLT